MNREILKESRLSLNLIKCYKCSNCWHGYKRCECDSLENSSKEEELDENNLENNLETDSDYTKDYFDDFVKCDNCGNIWDGNSQCNCWGYSENDYTENKIIDCNQTNDTCINNKDDN